MILRKTGFFFFQNILGCTGKPRHLIYDINFTWTVLLSDCFLPIVYKMSHVNNLYMFYIIYSHVQ